MPPFGLTMGLLRFGTLASLLCTSSVDAFWGAGDRQDTVGFGTRSPDADPARLPNRYAVALQELQDLESQPLCHRIAARYLVNDCQLLDGKDEATVLTDSGSKIRDFVDFYAASLAICDLERGAFSIPPACRNFREQALATIPLSKEPRLHVTSLEIDACLSGLAQSDSAWNTWVSYRHKALRFCEAARVDNDKAQSILLYQRLVKLLERLVEGVDLDIGKRLQDVGDRIHEMGQTLRDLDPVAKKAKDDLSTIEEIIGVRLRETVEESTNAFRSSLTDAHALQNLVRQFMQEVNDFRQQTAQSHETALQLAIQRTDKEFGAVLGFLSSVVDASVMVQHQLEQLHSKSLEVSQEQTKLGREMRGMLRLSKRLSLEYELHTERAEKAGEKASELLGILTQATTTASTVRDSIIHTSRFFDWWPYLVCPVASLVMGSYGLKPSGIRNIMLVALGEMAGHAVTTLDGNSLFSWHLTARTSVRTSDRTPTRTAVDEPVTYLNVTSPHSMKLL